MTALVLRWRQLPAAIVTQWRGPDARLAAAATAPTPQPLAAVIGPPGSAGGRATRIAGEPIGGQRAVAIGADGRAYLASPIEAQAQAVFGLSIGAAVAGANVTILCAGELIEPSWTWLPGAVWLGTNGVPTQVVPTVGAAVLLGTAAGPTAINVNPRLVARL